MWPWAKRRWPGNPPDYASIVQANQAFHPGIAVLDEIARHQDVSLGYQASCRRGFCSICTVNVNGKSVKTYLEIATEDMVLEPAARPGRVFKDLAIKW